MQTVRVAVHVIEVRELPGKDSAGLCDPFVRVTVAGQYRKQTTIRYGQTSTAFDEQFSFPDIQLTQEEYERATIRLEVFDARVFFRNELIGQCVFGIPSVRNLPKHEIYQQWVQLEHPQLAGYGQGFIRASVTVYGENDKPAGRSTRHANRTLREIQMTAPPSQVGQILTVPTMMEKRRGYNFVIKALRAEHLLSEGNTFLAIRFNGVLACTPTKAKSRNPDWNYQLTMAVFTPRYSDIIEVELWSSGGLSETLIASTTLKFSDIIAMSYPPTWFNFYGAPPEETGTLAAWWAERIHNKKVEPTGYLGRALLSLSAALTDNPQPDERLCEPLKGPDTEEYCLWIDILKGCELNIPKFGDVQVEIQFGPSENNRRTDWCKEEEETLKLQADPGNSTTVSPKPMRIVHFTCSPQLNHFKVPLQDDTKIKSKKGEPKHYAQFKGISIVLPKMEPTDDERVTNQLWDIIINVFARDGLNRVTRIGFVRIKPGKVWGFDNDPEWFPVRGFQDRTTGASESQGFLLVATQFGPRKLCDQFLEKKQRPQYGTLLQTTGEPYEIRAYVYQARNLPPSDLSTGLVSSYVEMNVGGVSGKRQYTHKSRLELDKKDESRTTTARNTLNPIWYDTLIIQNLILPQTDASTARVNAVDGIAESYDSGKKKKRKYISLALAPDIELTLKSEGTNNVLGRIRFPTQLCTRKYWPKRAKPRWIKFFRYDATAAREDLSRSIIHDVEAGELLVKLEAIPQDYANRRPWYNRHRWPKLQSARATMGTIGLRNLFMPGVRKGDDDGKHILIDDIPKPTKLHIQVPLFPDMRSIVKNALDEYDATKMKISGPMNKSRATGSSVVLDTGRGAVDTSRAGGVGLGIGQDGEEGEKFSDEESLDSDEKEDADYHEDFDDGFSLGDNARHSFEDEDMSPVNDIERGPDAAAGAFEDDNVQAIVNANASETKQNIIKAKVETSTQQDFAEVVITLDADVAKQLYRELRDEGSFSFFKIVALTINYPEDEFYAPSMTVRVLQTGGWSGTTDVVFGSCVIPLRPYSSTDSVKEKLVDQTLRLPMVALSKIGKDEFEAMARRDSDFTNSTIQTPRNRGGAVAAEGRFDMLSEGTSATDSTIHSIKFRETSEGSILPNEDEDMDVDNEEELDVPNGWPGMSEIPVTLTLNNEKLNAAFDVELNADNRHQMVPSLDPAVEMKRHRLGDEIDADEEAEKSEQDDAELENQLNDLEKQRQLQENKVLRELEEFTGVFWPVGASRKQLIKDCVDQTLEDDLFAIQPLPFSSFRLRKGSGKETDEVVGFFKAVLDVYPIANDATKELAPQVFSASQAKNFALDLSSDSRVNRYLTGGLDEAVVEEMGWKLNEKIARQEQLMYHRLEERGPENIKARIYIVQGTDFWSRNPDKCRPFLQLEMKVPNRSKDSFKSFTTLHDDSFNTKEGTNAFFGAVYELDARFPDITQLEIRAYDASPTFGGPDFIGATTVDLEDRWFNAKWQVMKEKKRILKEFRPLYLRNSTMPRGTLEMWVEMYSPLEAVNAKVTDIRMPKNDTWELRLVVWETHNVPPPEGQNYVSLYVTTELSYRGMDGKWRPDQYQSTDTHWWVDNGVGSFNWRKKFKLEVPCRFPRLTFKVWQTDLITVAPDQVVGTATVDIDFLASIANAWESDEPYERPKMVVKLTQDRGTIPRGDLEVQISLVRDRIAQLDPVGLARDPPNKDPFLPEPKRKSFWAMFFKSGSWYRCCCVLLIICVIIAVIVPLVILK